MSSQRCLCLAVWFASWVANAAAQQPPGTQPQSPTRQTPDEVPLQGVFSPLDAGIAPFQGFPTFPPNLSGYGNYPGSPNGVVPDPTIGDFALPPVLPQAPDWPSWLKVKALTPLPYQPDKAVLLRQSDRVWFRTPDEPAFIPLYYFDKMRPLDAGSEVEVRQSGEFQLLFFGGSRINSHGPAAVQVKTMSAEQLAVQIKSFTKLQFACRGRAHTIELPDGSTVSVAAESTSIDGADLRLERASEPGWVPGRATMFNAGTLAVTWHTQFGDRKIAPGFRATFLLTPPTTTISGSLQSHGVEIERRGSKLAAQGREADGVLEWSGARIHLPPGSHLELDPLLGDPFPAAAEKPK